MFHYEFIINNYNWNVLFHCYFFIIIQINWPFYRNHLWQITLVLVLLYGNSLMIFKHICYFSKHSVLLFRLIYRCFITLFSTLIFDYNFETFCSYKFVSCVLKSDIIDIMNRVVSIICICQLYFVLFTCNFMSDGICMNFENQQIYYLINIYFFVARVGQPKSVLQDL